MSERVPYLPRSRGGAATASSGCSPEVIFLPATATVVPDLGRTSPSPRHARNARVGRRHRPGPARGACIFAPFIWSATACQRKRLVVLLEAVHCSYLAPQKSVRRRTSFLGNHDTFWRSSLPRRALQTRARGLAREGPSFTVRTCTTAGGRKWGTLRFAKQRPVCTSWDTCRPFRTPGSRPRNYFRNVRHLISAPV